MTQPGCQPHGVLVVDKPEGPTSHDVVAQARRLYGTRAVGHAGTLDPMATGVLLILLGEATKLSTFLTGADKTYVAEVTLGTSTDTFDRLGTVLQHTSLPAFSVEVIEAALDVERNRLKQVPPAYSAIKVQGRTAHSMSRRGAHVELDARDVRVLHARLLEFSPPRLRVELHVSKGYYVRSFASDLGTTLGIPAHLSALRRTSSGSFGVEGAAAWPAAAPPALLSVAAAARLALPCAVLNTTGMAKARHGKLLAADDFHSAPDSSSPCAWLSSEGVLVAVGVGEPTGFRVRRGFQNLAQ